MKRDREKGGWGRDGYKEGKKGIQGKEEKK